MTRLLRLSLLTIALALCCCTYAAAQSDDTLKKVDTASSLSDDQIVAGVKQALELSTSKAVALTGRTDGFLFNENIRILLPPKLQAVGKAIDRKSTRLNSSHLVI